MKKPTLVKIPADDLTAFNSNDIMSSVAQLIVLSFATPHTLEEIQRAFRYMLTIYPKLRSIVVPTLFSYCYQILDDDDPRLELLFNRAFRVVPNLEYGTPAYYEYRQNLLNEPFSPLMELPIKIRYIGTQDNPDLLLSFNHMIGDALSYMHMVKSLMRYLNGEKVSPVPLDTMNLLNTQWRKPFSRIPRQCQDIWRVYKEDMSKAKQDKFVPLVEKPSQFFSPSNMYEHFIKYDVKTLRAKCSQLKCGLNDLMLTALAMALRKQFYKGHDDTFPIMMSFDMRQYLADHKPTFGNYAMSLPITSHAQYRNDPFKSLKDFQQQALRYHQQLQNGERIPYFINVRLSNLFGRRLYTYWAQWLKMRPKYMNFPCSFVNLANIDKLVTVSERVQLKELWSMVVWPGLFFGTLGFKNRLYNVTSYPAADFSSAEIIALAEAFEESLSEILALDVQI